MAKFRLGSLCDCAIRLGYSGLEFLVAAVAVLFVGAQLMFEYRYVNSSQEVCE